jgi:hypothetical protein
MKMMLVPGYSELFTGNSKSYKDWLEGISSEVVLTFFVALNNELNTPENGFEQQQRLLNLVCSNYTQEHRNILNNGYSVFIKKRGPVEIFSRRYLVPAIIKELKRNFKSENYNTTPDESFQIFMAYLVVIDELNDEMSANLEGITKDSIVDEYELLWPTFIDQYEYNQQVDAAFEFTRLLCYCRYSLTHLRQYLKEYLVTKGLTNLSEFLAVNKLVADSTNYYKPDKIFRKFRFIDPSPHVDRTFLESLTINHIAGDANLALSHLRKYPLYKTIENKYIVLDDDFYRKKIYIGPFFEIYYNTSLRTIKSFNQHSTEISKGTMEELMFQGICMLMRKSKHQVMHFDNGPISEPDCYSRFNKEVIFIEFKDYVFRESLMKERTYLSIKSYIDQKFVESKEGKSKGISQLVKQIDNFYKQMYSFDKGAEFLLNQKKKLKLYPVICYSDFMFSLPGINKYLNDRFEGLFDRQLYPNLEVQPLTMINIQNVFDFALRGKDLFSLTDLIDQYWKVISDRNDFNYRYHSTDAYLLSIESFDELYQGVFFEKMQKIKPNSKSIKELKELIGLTDEHLNMIL